VKFWSVNNLAEFLGVPKTWIYDRAQANGPEVIPHVKFGKYVRFKPESRAFQEWLDGYGIGRTVPNRIWKLRQRKNNLLPAGRRRSRQNSVASQKAMQNNVQQERQRRVTEKGEEATMTRRTFQQGYVLNPIRTRNGTAFNIHYRVPAPGGKWKQRSETLYGLSGKKAARAVLEERIKNAAKIESTDMTPRVFVDTFWKPYLDRKNLKPATRSGYQSVLDYHLFPDLGDFLLSGITPLHIANLIRKKEIQKLSPKSIRNILVVFQGIFNVAMDNDLIQRSPI
jgi:hypothetical protein